MKSVKYLFTTIPGAVILGSLLISLSILVSGGVIKFKKPFTSPTTSTPSQAAQPAADNSNLKDKLVSLAKEQKLDEGKFRQCLDKNNSEEIKKDIADAQKFGISGTPGFVVGKVSNGEIDGVKISGAYPYEVFEAVFNMYLNGSTTQDILNSEETISLGGVSEKLSDMVSSGKATVDDDPALGSNNAALTVVEFSDYECPFCQRHFKQTYSNIKSNFIDNGKVKLVYRDFIAVPSHDPVATIEAVAANCAREQGGDEAYFKFHDEIFKRTTSNGVGI